MEKTKEKDFVEIEFTGTANGNMFDSNIPEDLKKISKESKPKKTIVIIGEESVVKGLDKKLEDREIGKEYEVEIPYKEGFGERKRELVKTIPLHIFTKQKLNPQPGSAFFMDNAFARVITVSGARVITDFNNPLAGKDLHYKFKIIKKLTNEKEKVEAFFENFLKFVPKLKISEKIIVKGQKNLEQIIIALKDKFKELLKKELIFEEEKETKKEEKVTEKETILNN
ncbi:hypothetical protein CXT76_02265 [Candidatus Parvarchaeota archaeon]|jgi:FKBP-type peptidyl-prolyl cis-trans isomerase 2|nr:MAG: hypothetical protein CXT76_02265 [Candidatus Parvarchaeota archaeon]HIG52304.1 hypothetical protein [Candidatus Pacearchaeota archaeon]